uniref:Large ribosomal subunit protein uL3m n=1 Tax=Caenorhabditis tropicalis TaxID=1561998 RepID=A0A1I7U346_9PELO
MLRSLISNVTTGPTPEWTGRILMASGINLNQQRGRRRTLTPVPWLPPIKERIPRASVLMNEETKSLLESVVEKERLVSTTLARQCAQETHVSVSDIPESSRRVGLVVQKIGMIPQWTTDGNRILCTVLQVDENHVVSVTSPENWYKASAVGKRKAYNRQGPMWRVTVGTSNDNPTKYTLAYRKQFLKAGIPTKAKVGSFLVTEDALPTSGQPLDARHFSIGQYVTVTGKTIDWGFQGGMHRWGMRGQPTRRTTKSHRRIGSVGSVGDARIWPGKRMPGHMGYEWRTVSGLEVVRINVDKQVIYVKGSVPGDIGETLLLKDCLQEEKRLRTGPMPTWAPSLETIEEEPESSPEEVVPKNLLFHEQFSPKLFRFTSPSIAFTDADAKKATGRDKTKAKIAKVKK